ncbi:MAG: 3-deoxy-manno-octulosonate cytidylyltransferase [Ignavibacteria bacterium]|nr:3-deoxy-manno-octulosonate cytidylyltransferase [Ignavibacteria bacterium]
MEERVDNSIGIIPARLGSTRLKRKLLLDLCGKPVLQWTWEGASKSSLLKKIIVATDSNEIAELCLSIGAEYILTKGNFQSGTDRVLWAFKELNDSSDFIVNIQGDEPFVNGPLLDSLVLSLYSSRADVSTPISRINSIEELLDTSVVKVVFANDKLALFFSRQPIPFVRDLPMDMWMTNFEFYKHIGLYCFRRQTLLEYSQLLPSKLEIAEKLEQNRLLENGRKILCVPTDAKLISIDTPNDLQKARDFIISRISS